MEWFMAGTDGSGEYDVLLRTDSGAVGIRNVEPGSWRIRVEPVSKEAAKPMLTHFKSLGWQTPDDGKLRYSYVVKKGGPKALYAAISAATAALGKAGLVENPESKYLTLYASCGDTIGAAPGMLVATPVMCCSHCGGIACTGNQCMVEVGDDDDDDDEEDEADGECCAKCGYIACECMFSPSVVVPPVPLSATVATSKPMKDKKKKEVKAKAKEAKPLLPALVAALSLASALKN